MRKLLDFFFTSIVAVPIVACLLADRSMPFDIILFIQLLGFVSLYVIPLILIYAVPVSVFSDKVTSQIKGFLRLMCAFLIHLFFGVFFAYLFVPVVNGFRLFDFDNSIDRFIMLGASITSLIFWSIDELIRYSYKKRDLLYDF